jgi:hypothetical protein
MSTVAMESQPLKRVYFDTNALYRWPNSANNLMLPFGVANWLKTELDFPKAVDSVPTVCRIHPAMRVTAQNHCLTVGGREQASLLALARLECANSVPNHPTH